VLRAGQIQGEGFIVFSVQTKLETFLLAHLAHQKLSKNKKDRIEKVTAPKVEGVNN